MERLAALIERQQCRLELTEKSFIMQNLVAKLIFKLSFKLEKQITEKLPQGFNDFIASLKSEILVSTDT